MTGDKTHLIVTGVARSGTTALAELLNSHPGICVGIERFKFRYLRENIYDAALFEKERFFDFREGDTNLLPTARPAWAPVYEQMAAKWDDAGVIGDKTPDMIPILEDFVTANPDFRVICILRNLKDVGRSWQTRADKPRDAWPKGRGFVAASESWANQHLILHDLLKTRKKLRERVMLLDYDRMYEDPDVTERGMLQFLDVPPAPEFRACLLSHADFTEGRASKKVPRKFVDVYGAVEMGPYRGLRKVALEQIQTLADAYDAKTAGDGTA